MNPSGLIIGHSRDSTIRHVRSVARVLGANVEFLDIGEWMKEGSIIGACTGEALLSLKEKTYRFSDFQWIYQRGYLTSTPTPINQGRLLAMETALCNSNANIINRPNGGWQNMSKPLQMFMLEEFGFCVPPSRSTGIPTDYHQFREQERDIIYKSNSGLRSIVDGIGDEQDCRAEALRYCPVLFQRRIVGVDVRVHVLCGEAFSVRAQSDAIDYRYYRLEGSFLNLEAISNIPEEIEQRCTAFAKASGVNLAGFDFKIDANGLWHCLEMNPSPAFESYDHVLENRIACRIINFNDR